MSRLKVNLKKLRVTMTPRKSLLRCCRLLLVSGAGLAIMFAGARVTTADELKPQTAVVSAKTTWLRQTVQFSGAATNVRVLLSSQGNVAAYFNGQRLSRSAAFEDSVLAWDVSTLLRPGTNCLAIVLNTNDEAQGSIAAWSDGVESAQWEPNPWKSTTTPPPIGWQQTDFNDRDWAVAVAGAALDLKSSAPNGMRQQAWAVDAGASRKSDLGFAFRDGDHVVLLGGTFVERAQEYGYLETSLNSLSKNAHVTFRNLGWSADTVFAASRGIFDSPTKGYERMIEHVRAEEPTVIFLCYGQNEAMEFPSGDPGLQMFKSQLKQLYVDLQPTGAEIVIVSPHPFLETPPPLPNPTRWNPRLQQYAGVAKSVALSVDTPFVDLFSAFLEGMEQSGPRETVSQLAVDDIDSHPDLSRVHFQSWTDNGMHWNAAGYARVAPLLAARLNGKPFATERVVVNYTTKQVLPSVGQIRNINWSAENRFQVQFEFRAKSLSVSPLTIQLTDKMLDLRNGFNITSQHESGLPTDLSNVVTGDEESLTFCSGQSTRFEFLRQLTVSKNELYFHRWRPQNITYLFGFRKHEQGNNAIEIAQFDPLIDEIEKQIHDAKQTQWQTITISQSDDQ